MPVDNPELGQSILVDGRRTHYHDVGAGFPALLIHGSGPGVSAFANWRLNMPELAKQCRVIAPDMAGFGATERFVTDRYRMATWVEHLRGLMDALELEQVDLVGNSFGGGLALQFAHAYPKRVRRMVLMGAVGVSFPLTKGLDQVWAYEPSLANMRKLLDLLAYDKSLVNEELVKLRHAVANRPGVQESFAAMFPSPRQRWIDELASDPEALRQLDIDTLIVHGRDDEVIPLQASLDILNLMPNCQLHVFGRCGHWVQIEHADRFNRLVTDFLNEN